MVTENGTDLVVGSIDQDFIKNLEESRDEGGVSGGAQISRLYLALSFTLTASSFVWSPNRTPTSVG